MKLQSPGEKYKLLAGEIFEIDRKVRQLFERFEAHARNLVTEVEDYMEVNGEKCILPDTGETSSIVFLDSIHRDGSSPFPTKLTENNEFVVCVKICIAKPKDGVCEYTVRFEVGMRYRKQKLEMCGWDISENVQAQGHEWRDAEGFAVYLVNFLINHYQYDPFDGGAIPEPIGFQVVQSDT